MSALTTEQAATRLGISPNRIRVLIREGRLPAKEFGKVYMIEEADLKHVENRKPGRPPQKPAKAATKKGGKK
ncbi:MAG: helix-turn-helix domain-containing protein [Rubrivivax sp.]|nr:helix-turn-helix domain-containing protein [Pyrinomonadaceae bacterium]